LTAHPRQDDLVQAGILSVHQAACAFVNGLQLFGDGESIGPGLIRAELEPLLEAGDANLEELIEIVRRDAQEPEPFE
jgi:hypothetical protein